MPQLVLVLSEEEFENLKKVCKSLGLTSFSKCIEYALKNLISKYTH